jgi:hypothetical protein
MTCRDFNFPLVRKIGHSFQVWFQQSPRFPKLKRYRSLSKLMDTDLEYCGCLCIIFSAGFYEFIFVFCFASIR